MKSTLTLFGLLIAGSLLTTVRADTEPYSSPVEDDFPRGLFWGDLHVHSRFSPDSYSFGNDKLSADDAYRFAKGETIQSHVDMPVRLRRPLDFLMVADHAEFLGVFPKLEAQDPALLDTELGKRWNAYREADDQPAIMAEFVDAIQNPDYVQELPESFRSSIWQEAAAAAERHNVPRAFTAFIGYEWTSMVEGNNLHRVVVFRDGADVATRVPPFSSLDSQDPEALWAALARYEERTGGDVLAIAHNGNLSNGLMFAETTLSGEPIDEAYAQMRSTWEPLYEVTQVKGDGEAHPYLSPDDGFADFETWDADNIGRSTAKENRMLRHEYARGALQVGLRLADRVGANPYAFGLIGSTDSHTTFATADDDNFWGKFPDSEPAPERTSNDMGGRLWANWRLAASGYAAVWATENTREALFDAMERREVYASTGPRIALRFFGGWQFESDDANAPDIARTGYGKGVPMGGSLPIPAESGAQTPSFLLAASKDPDGANLDRVQVVKGWLAADGSLQEQVFDVALSDGRKPHRRSGRVPPVGSTVDVEGATYNNSIGDASLVTVWQDPAFDPAIRAFYYARVIEIPTPRWTAYDAKYFDLELPDDVPMITQERAYSSPIWYTPSDATASTPTATQDTP